jgi:hypothetical protein
VRVKPAKYTIVIRFFLFGGLFLFLSSCCANERCDCRDQTADGLYFRFSRDTATTTSPGFRASETKSFSLIRLALDSLDRPRIDTVRLSAPIAATRAYDFVINATGPFSRNARKASQYTYILTDSTRTTAETFNIKISDIKISGRYAAVNSCCTCYENVRKVLRINNGPELDLATPPNAAPIIAELRKL